MPPKAALRRAAPSRGNVNADAEFVNPGPSRAAATDQDLLNPPQSENTDAAQPRPRDTSAARAPVERLQTLKKWTPGGTLIPLNPDGLTPKPTLKYQPRAVARKSKEERGALERQEEERRRERNAEAAVARPVSTGISNRGLRRGRGRGAVLSQAGEDVSGPLGAGVSIRTRGGGGTGAYGARAKGEYGRSSSGRVGSSHAVTKTEPASGKVSSDEESDSGPRFSIDQINIVSDSEDGETDIGKGKAPTRTRGRGSRGLRPVRVERQEPIERAVGANVDPSSSKSAELRRLAKEKAGGDDNSLFVQDTDEETIAGINTEVGVVATEMSLATVAGDEGPRIKEEPADGDVLMAYNIPPVASDATVVEARGPQKGPVKAQNPKFPAKGPRSLLPTEEEEQERKRHEQDIAQLKKALGPVRSTLDNTTGGDSPRREGEDKGEDARDERHGRLFLIQFPPMTPNLVVPKACQGDLILDAAEARPAPLSIPLEEASPAIKEESCPNDVPTLAPPLGIPSAITEPPTLVTATNNQLPPGRVGKLQIHQSGRATIDWGGIRFELSKGSDVDFLQDAVVASEQIHYGPTESGDSPGRRVWAMSQVRGKFVVTPDWDELL